MSDETHEPEAQEPQPEPTPQPDPQAPDLSALLISRAKELQGLFRNGYHLTTGQKNLLDFYNVDFPRGAMPTAELLAAASSVNAALHWRRGF